MNKRSLIILVVIFVILIGLVFVKKNMQPRVPTKEEAVDIIVPPVNMDDFSEISLRLGDGSAEEPDKPKNVRLVKEENGWTVQDQYGVRANESVITSALEKLDQLKGELRSDKANILKDYGITGDKALHVLLQHEGGVIHLVVGLEKGGGRDNFVRFSERNAVYAVNENLLGAFGVRDIPEDEGGGEKLDVQKWVDKRITHFNTNEVAGIAVTQQVNGAGETVMDIRKATVDDKKKWQSAVPYAFNLSASKIKDKLDKWNNTYAREVIAPDTQGVFDAPDWTAVFTMENGDQVSLVRGAKDADGKNYYMKREGAGYYYLVPVSTFESREKLLGDIFAGNPLDVTEDNLQEIAVNDLDAKKKFDVTKSAPEETAEPESEGGKPKEEYIWKDPEGQTIERSKVQAVINKIKDMNLEVIPKQASSPKGAVTVDITKDGATRKYTIGQDVKLDNGKECHIFKVAGDDQDYCASKSQVTALKNALP